jgi:hypothetical protein
MPVYPPKFFVFYAVRVVSKESTQMFLPRTKLNSVVLVRKRFLFQLMIFNIDEKQKQGYTVFFVVFSK